jgi:putative PIN family toxin of toxin-antitoxin system
MEQKSRLKVFLDTSTVIAGIASSSGAAKEVINLAEMRLITIYISRQVIIEADRNIKSKLPEMLKELRAFIKILSPVLVDDPTTEEIKKYSSCINQNDAPILSAAISSGADYLVTWDKKHFIKKRSSFAVNIKIVTPGEFLQNFRKHIEGLK